MGRAIIADVNEAAAAQFPVLTGVTATGDVATKAVVANAKRPLLLWQHVLSPGAEIRWDKPPVGHLVYVFEGEGEANGEAVSIEDALMVGHGGAGSVRAGTRPLTVLHFHRPDDFSVPPSRAGGCSHVLHMKNGTFFRFPAHPEVEGCLLADSSCPTCELWFHTIEIHGAQAYAEEGLHYHTEDEIIVVTGGEMMVGNRAQPRGTVLAVDANVLYTFGASDKGLQIINFRPAEPLLGSKPGNPLLNERQSLLDCIRQTKELGLKTRADSWASA